MLQIYTLSLVWKVRDYLELYKFLKLSESDVSCFVGDSWHKSSFVSSLRNLGCREVAVVNPVPLIPWNDGASHRFLLTSQVVILSKPHIRWHLSYLHLFCFPSMAIGSSMVTLLFPNKALEQRILGLRKVALEWPWFVLIAVRLCIKKVFWVRTHSEHYRGGGIHVLHWHSARK